MLHSLAGWIIAFLLGLGATLHTAQPADAYEPEKDYWFIERFTLGELNLPQGVTILTSDPTLSPRGHLVLQNQTDTPLYVMSLNYKNVLVMSTPDPDWKTRVNLAHEAASYLVLPGRPAALAIEALIDLDKNLMDQNVRSFDPPPADLSAPAEQSSELLLVYDGQVIEVPFAITYSINTKYNNGSEAYRAWMENAQATDNASATATQVAANSKAAKDATILGMGITAIVASLMVGGWIAWRIITRRT